MTHALLIRLADDATRVAGPRTTLVEWHDRAQHMCYAHPSNARTSWRAFSKKFPAALSGHIVPFRDLPGVFSGRLPLPHAIE